MSRSLVGGLTGIIGGVIGAVMGYRQALEVAEVSPWEGALIFGTVGLVVGALGGLLFRGLSAIIIYAVLIGILGYFFREQIEAMTGTDPVEAAINIFNDFLTFVQGKISERRVN